MSQGICPIIHLNEKQNGETSGDRGKKKGQKERDRLTNLSNL